MWLGSGMVEQLVPVQSRNLPEIFYFEVPSPATNIRASITPLISSVRIFRQALGVFDFMASCAAQDEATPEMKREMSKEVGSY